MISARRTLLFWQKLRVSFSSATTSAAALWVMMLLVQAVTKHQLEEGFDGLKEKISLHIHEYNAELSSVKNGFLQIIEKFIITFQLGIECVEEICVQVPDFLLKSIFWHVEA